MFTPGATISRKFPGRLMMEGVSQAVTITVTGRDGPAIQAVDRFPRLGFLGSLADYGIPEVRLILHRVGAA